MEYLNTALLLLVIGISTVFVVLIFLILSGNVLIKVVNRYFPEQSLAPPQNNNKPIQHQSEMAIRQAIEMAGKGEWSVISIQKVTN